MIIQTLTHWLHLLVNNKKSSPSLRNINVHVITDYNSQDDVPPLVKMYFPKATVDKAFMDFSFRELFFGNLHFAGKPGKKNLSFSQKIKRAIIRIFFTDYEKLAGIWNLIDTIFLPSHDKSFFTPYAHIVKIYEIHFPAYDVREISGYENNFRNLVIHILAALSKKKFCEYNSGITVFTNMADPHLLKAYHLIHPNKAIFLRFHDRLDQISRKKWNAKKLRQTLHQLMMQGIIQDAESYYEKDAKTLGITYRCNAVDPVAIQKVNHNFRNYFYTFIGTYKDRRNQSRLNDLNIIRDHLCKIFPSAKKYVQEYIVFFGETTQKLIPYSQYLELTGQSEVIIDFYRTSPDEGFSFRIPEAMMLERKVITNRLIVLNQTFYDPSRFFIIGHDSLDRLEAFVKGDFKPLSPETRMLFDCSHWWENKEKID